MKTIVEIEPLVPKVVSMFFAEQNVSTWPPTRRFESLLMTAVTS